MLAALAAAALAVSVLALGLVVWLWRRSDSEALRAELALRWTEHLQQAQTFYESIQAVATDVEDRRRKLQGLLDKQRQRDQQRANVEAAAGGAPPGDEMEAARQRLRSRGTPFSG